ncbi:MAG: serine hydrolase [Candidatus Hydrogenedentes bacterium]|nr:serine hydrolase [Candidatus Hydrogenedentota bacterium]
MWKSRWFWLKLCAALVGAALVGVLVLAATVLPVLTGYKAKVLASGVFVARRPFESVIEQDVDFLARKLNWSIDQEERSVTVSLWGFAPRTALVHTGLGATLLPENREAVSFDPGYTLHPVPKPDLDAYWPLGDDTSKRAMAPDKRAALDAAVEWAFADPAPDESWGTRATIVAQHGNILSERYNRGFGMSTPLHGWSMSKSIVNALVGILVMEGKLDIQKAAPVREWSDSGDPRSAITVHQLLQMSSGLAFNESYMNPYGDVLRMLFREGDFAGYAVKQPLAAAPGTVWSYSSGTTNLLCRIIRQRVGGSDGDYFNFPRTALFGKLGMTSAILEPDASGTFAGSSYAYATARDWARFGQFFLQDGVWNGERLLPEGWVKYSTTPAPGAPQGKYGAHWWLNTGEPEHPDNRTFPSLPPDLYYASGHEGQYVVIVPSRSAVIVRLGVTRGRDFDLETFVGKILDSLEE